MNKPGSQAQMSPQPITIDPNYKGSDKLKGKIALITGGDSGIGRAVAVHFAREGAHIIINYLQENEDAQETKQLVEREGVSCMTIMGNLTEDGFCEQLINQVKTKHDHIDILVNNAATQTVVENIKNIKLDDIKKTFDTNIVYMIHLTKLVLDMMPEGSRIINSTSVTSYQGHEELVDYASTKGAITAFTRSLSGQLAAKKILVNAVAPGPIWTPLIPATMGVKKEEFGQGVPLGRCGEPAEVAPSYVFLASQDCSYMTGQVLHVNGGVVVGG